MTNPPGMVVDVSGGIDGILFSLWNYTDAAIRVNVEAEAVPPTEPLPANFFDGNVTVPVNATHDSDDDPAGRIVDEIFARHSQDQA